MVCCASFAACTLSTFSPPSLFSVHVDYPPLLAASAERSIRPSIGFSSFRSPILFPSSFFLFFLSFSTLLFLPRWIILLNERRFFLTLHHLVSRDLTFLPSSFFSKFFFYLIQTISSPSFKITWYLILISTSPSFLPLSFSSFITCFARSEKQAYAWAEKNCCRLYSSYKVDSEKGG